MKMLPQQFVWLSACFLFFAISNVHCWDSQELELFDLVEEVNANFYEVLGVEQTATSAEIRKAYRRLSVKLHPDKNKEEDAEEKFRKVVAIYEVLKDEQQRLRYNEVLANGLPDWRTPVYYYRKARKLGLLELTILLFVIITIGQFIVGWSMYLEKKFEMEEVFLSRKKKDKKGKKGRQMEKDMDEALQEHLDTLPKPRLRDLLPCKLVLGLIALFTSLPELVQRAKEWNESRKQPQELTSDEESEAEEVEEKVKRPKRRQRVDIPEFNELLAEGTPVVYMAEAENHIEEKRNDRTGKEWTDDEVSFLSKAVAKFPSGTQNRWDKIAEMVGRSVSEVTSKCKSIKQNVIVSVDPASQGVTGSVNEKLAFKKGMTLTQDITRSNMVENVPQTTTIKPAAKTDKPPTKPIDKRSAKTEKTNTKSTEKTATKVEKITPAGPTAAGDGVGGAAGGQVLPGAVEGLDGAAWTQTQQKTLEWALSQYPRGTTERWEKVAEHITGKTKDDCLARFKYLADVIKRKKEEAALAKQAKS